MAIVKNNTVKVKEVKEVKKPVGVKKIGKIAKMVEMLQTGEHTIEELVAKSGASLNTVKLQLSYYLNKKKGFIVVKNAAERDGKKVVVYKIS